jgi:hypothetical protein
MFIYREIDGDFYESPCTNVFTFLLISLAVVLFPCIFIGVTVWLPVRI